MDVEDKNVKEWKLEEFTPELMEFKKTLKALGVPDSPFRWNPRDGIFAHARELPPSIDVADMLDGIERAPGLKGVEYPIKTLYWRIMVVIGACYEYVHMKEYLKARRRLKKLIKLLRDVKQSREPYSLKYHTAFSYIAYALLTRDETEPEDQSVDQPSPSCSSAPGVRTNIPLKKELPTDPIDCRIRDELRYAIYEYGALFFKRYGLKGIKRAKQYLSTVIDEREPKEAWWYFERAKILARERGSVAAWKLPTPTREEFEDIDAALRTKAHPFYQLHFAELKGQMRTWGSTGAALKAYISFGNNPTNSPDLLCKCVEGILDLIRACDHGFLIEKVKKFLGRKDTFKKMINAALQVLYLSTQSDYECNTDMVYRCFGHIHLLEKSKNNKIVGIGKLKACDTHTYDSAFELIRLEQSDRCKELLYLLMQTQTNRAVKTFFAREVIMHFLFSLKNLKSAVGTAVICLQKRRRIADVRMVYNPRLLYLRTRHGIDCIDVLEWKIKKDPNSAQLVDSEPYRTFFELLRQQRRSYYGKTGPQVDFGDLSEFISLAPMKPRKHNDHPDVTGSTYISRKVGALPVIYSPVLEPLPLSGILYRGGLSCLPGIKSIRQVRARLSGGKNAFIEIAKTIHRHFNTPAVETLASNRATPIDPCTLDLLREDDLVQEGDTQTEKLSEISQGQRPERLQALKFRPQKRYDRVKRSGVLIPCYDSDGSISETSIFSSDDEADAGRVSRQGRKGPSSAVPGTARTSPVASPQPPSLPGTKSLGQEGMFVEMEKKNQKIIITQPEELDSEESSENLISQRKRPMPRQGIETQLSDSDTSSVQSFKVVLTEETPDEVMPDAGQENLPPQKKYKLVDEQQKQVGYTETQSVPATPAQVHPSGFPLVKQSGTSDLSHPTGKSTAYPVADTAKALEMLSIVSTQSVSSTSLTSSAQGSDVQVASDEGAANKTAGVRQAPATDKKSSPQAMELEGDEEGTSTGKRDDIH